MRPEDYVPSPTTHEVSSEAGPGGGATLLFARELDRGAPAVWTELTDARRIPGWKPFTPSRDLDAPGPVVFVMNYDAEPDRYDCVVREAAAERALEYTWAGGVLRWELAPAGGGARLTLRHALPDPSTLAAAAAGWHMCLDLLARRLDGEVFDIRPMLGRGAMDYGWEALAAHYRERLGVPAEAPPEG